VKENSTQKTTPVDLLERLQEIYTQIDEPDGIEGISAHLPVLNIEQQILGHRKAGRWSAAQSWYEIKLAENPKDYEAQSSLLTCLKESGQHEGTQAVSVSLPKILPFATEAAWSTEKWTALEKYICVPSDVPEEDFNVNIGRALLALRKADTKQFRSII
ncbi:hypothetical protein DH86_00003467, partial [Scytalidium sp. 3C]